MCARVAEPGAALEPGTVYVIEGRDTVTDRARAGAVTLNLAMTHRDGGAGMHGRRLVYGGQTISIAAAHAARALPALATIVAWRSCEHSAPVFEGDVLSTEVAVGATSQSERRRDARRPARHRSRRLRGTGEPPEQVLDWAFVGVLA